MKTFGIQMAERNYPYNHYVVEDNITDESVLFEWLVSDDFLPSEEVGCLRVTAPKGYLFQEEFLVPVSTLTAAEIQSVDDDESGIWSDMDVTVAYRHVEKAAALMGVIMKDVSPKEFYALDIPEERVLAFTID